MMKVVKQDVQGIGYCFYYSSGQPRESYQHASFKNRVELKDSGMENGDVSVFLKNVSLNDTGTYECVVGYEKAGSDDRGPFRHSNHLTVKDAHVQDRDDTGLVLQSVLLPLVLLLLFILMVTLLRYLILRFVRRPRQSISTDPTSHILLGNNSDRT